MEIGWYGSYVQHKQIVYNISISNSYQIFDWLRINSDGLISIKEKKPKNTFPISDSVWGHKEHSTNSPLDCGSEEHI
jgi:hypothetical protein